MIVDNCRATLNVDEVVMPSLVNMWYDSPVNYDISAITTQVIPSVNCNYPFEFKIFRVEPVTNNLIALPKEVTFDDQALSMSISKCSPLGQSSPIGDTECDDGTTPYEKNFNLVLEITLVQVGDNFVAYVPFTAQITNPCIIDTVSFNPATLESSRTYIIRDTGLNTNMLYEP